MCCKMFASARSVALVVFIVGQLFSSCSECGVKQTAELWLYRNTVDLAERQSDPPVMSPIQLYSLRSCISALLTPAAALTDFHKSRSSPTWIAAIMHRLLHQPPHSHT